MPFSVTCHMSHVTCIPGLVGSVARPSKQGVQSSARLLVCSSVRLFGLLGEGNTSLSSRFHSPELDVIADEVVHRGLGPSERTTAPGVDGGRRLEASKK